LGYCRSLTFYFNKNIYFALVLWSDAAPTRIHWQDENHREIPYPDWAPASDRMLKIANEIDELE
jgi:hypothetical protein